MTSYAQTLKMADRFGSKLVGYKGTNVYDKLASLPVSVFEYGAVGDGVTDDTAAIQLAVNYVQSTVNIASGSNAPANGPQELLFPPGLYLVTDAIQITQSISLRGDGHSEYSTGARIQQQTPAKDIFQVNPIAQGCSVSFTDLVLRANGGGGTSGALINITKAAGQCSSIRISRCTFGTPQSWTIKIQQADDVLIDNCLFDVSATNCISLGTATAANLVTNTRIIGCYFFSINGKCIAPYNVDGLIISNCTVYSATNTAFFIDGVNTLPYQIRNVTIHGNTFKNVFCIAYVSAVNEFVVSNNVGYAIGGAVSSTQSLLQFTGTCSGAVVTNNRFSGNLGTFNFYDDSAATITSSTVSSNSFTATGGAGAAMRSSNTRGCIGHNSITGFTQNCMGHSWVTSSSAISPGVIGANSNVIMTQAVTGAIQSDGVRFGTAGSTWVAPDGIIVAAYTTTNQLNVKYSNITAGAIGVPPHDISVLVTR